VATRAEAALGLARGGWLVFPLHHHVGDGRCSCGDKLCFWPHSRNAAKHPRWEKGTLEKGLLCATSDVTQVMAWWGKWPEANIGLRTGDGVFVVDVDGPEGAAYLAERGVPNTLSATTGRGTHLYFFAPEGIEIRNRAKIAPDLDVRGDGGYVLAPCSEHASGAVYAWVDQEAEIAEAPEWLVDAVREREAPEREPVVATYRAPGEITPYAKAALEREFERLSAAGEGSRNHTLFCAVANLAELVAGGELPESLVRDESWAIARAIGLEEMETRRTIDSAFRKASRNPRVAPEPRTRREAPRGASQSASPAVMDVDPEIVAEPFVPEQGSPNGHVLVLPAPAVEYPLGVWPSQIAEFIAATAHSVCVQPEAVGTAVLAVAASVIGRARWLDVKGEGGWIERPGIYAGLVGDVSRRKSPALRAAKAPLEALHAERAAKWNDEHERWEAEPGTKGEPQLESPLMKDVTTEVLALALKAHPRGVVLVADELIGWLNSMGQYKGGKGNDRQRWVEAWNGDTIDVFRASRKRIVVEHPCVSVVGGVQPDVFAGLTAVRDGLAERFLYCVMPKVPVDANTPDVPRSVRGTWDAIVRGLYDLREAQVVCDVPGCLTAARQRAVDALNEAPEELEGYLGKGETHLGRIAIVLAAVWEVCGGERELTAAGVGRAEDLWGFYADQARRLFTGDLLPVKVYQIASPMKERDLIAWLRARDGTGTKREAMRGNGPLRNMAAKDADAVIYVCAARGNVQVENGARGSVILTLAT
jgi:bifunctional DNA primase/polymerase-like protein/uncharacterized protein DUF3987